MKADSPFSGIKVLAVTRVVAAPFATYQLALHGADVITVEDAERGDQARRNGNKASGHMTSRNMGPIYLAHASNKRSLTLNIAHPEGQEIFRRLARDADVVVENLRTGNMARYGLDYESLRQINPRLIYCSLTGYGQTGPKARDPAIDPVIQAACGLMHVTGSEESGPLKVGAVVVDYGAGYAAAFAIAMALFHRERTGLGQHIDASLLETGITMMSNLVCEALSTGVEPRRTGNRSPFGAPTTGSYRCREGDIFISAGTDGPRTRLLKAVGLGHLLEDARFATREACREHPDELFAFVGEALSRKTADEWEKILNDAGVSAMKVRSIGEIAAHPQVAQRGLLHRMENVGGMGFDATVPMTPYKMSLTPARIVSQPPRHGQHTEEILQSLGLDGERIKQLRAGGVV